MGQQLIGEDGRAPLPVQPAVTSGDWTTADRRGWTSFPLPVQPGVMSGEGTTADRRGCTVRVPLPVQPGVTSGEGTTADRRGWTSSPLISKSARQPWYPQRDTRPPGSSSYMPARAPPKVYSNDVNNCNCEQTQGLCQSL
jgi:hypothetical protein